MRRAQLAVGAALAEARAKSFARAQRLEGTARRRQEIAAEKAERHLRTLERTEARHQAEALVQERVRQSAYASRLRTFQEVEARREAHSLAEVGAETDTC